MGNRISHIYCKKNIYGYTNNWSGKLSKNWNDQDRSNAYEFFSYYYRNRIWHWDEVINTHDNRFYDTSYSSEEECSNSWWIKHQLM